MSGNDASPSDAPATPDKSISTSSFTHRLLFKLQSTVKQVSKASVASKPVKETCGAETTNGEAHAGLRFNFQKVSDPSDVSAASQYSEVSGYDSLCELIPRTENASQKSGASTSPKDSKTAEKRSRGPFSKICPRLRKLQSGVECPSRCLPKPPIIRSKTQPGPSNLEERRRGSTLELAPRENLDVLSKYWHFRDIFDRLARRSYRQGEEIECLLRCTKAPPRLLGLDGYLSCAHTELHKGLRRLHGCIKEEEANLDQEVARIVLNETKVFMEILATMTASLQHACDDLEDIFDHAGSSEGTLETNSFKSRMAFSEAWERRFACTCWNLCRETQRLIYAIRREGRNGNPGHGRG